MKTIKNTGRRPISVPLPRGRKLYLGPLHTAEVQPSTLEHPPFVELVEAGTITVIGEGDHSLPHPMKKERAAGSSQGPGRPRPGTEQHGDR